MLMFYLAGPIAIALSKILLQTTPDAALRALEVCLREVRKICPELFFKKVCLIIGSNSSN
jgi:hypothetical protein